MFLSPGSRAHPGRAIFFPRGTQLTFINAAAPPGRTRVTANDDSILRINGSTTPGTGGSNGFVAAFNTQTATGNFTITSGQVPNLTLQHVYENFGSGTTSGQFTTTTGTQLLQDSAGTVGSGGAHNHSITTSIKYVDVLVAKKN